MHELSIAQSILDIITEEMQKHHVERIVSVRLKIGELSAVVPESLTFCWSIVTKDTPAEGSRLDIVSLPIEAKCLSCGNVFFVQNYVYVCPNCESGDLTILSGKELQIQDFETPDA